MVGRVRRHGAAIAIVVMVVVLATALVACSGKKTELQGQGGGELPNNGFPQQEGTDPAEGLTLEQLVEQITGEPAQPSFLKFGKVEGPVSIDAMVPPSGQTKQANKDLRNAGVEDLWIIDLSGKGVSYGALHIGEASDEDAAKQAAIALNNRYFDMSEPKPDGFQATIGGQPAQGYSQATFPEGTSNVMLFTSDGTHVLWLRLAGDDTAVDTKAAEDLLSGVSDSFNGSE